jgi:hypothetical protein
MARTLHEQHDLSELFVIHLLSRNIRFEVDLFPAFQLQREVSGSDSLAAGSFCPGKQTPLPVSIPHNPA